jgi:hypothetical protein
MVKEPCSGKRGRQLMHNQKRLIVKRKTKVAKNRLGWLKPPLPIDPKLLRNSEAILHRVSSNPLSICLAKVQPYVRHRMVGLGIDSGLISLPLPLAHPQTINRVLFEKQDLQGPVFDT